MKECWSPRTQMVFRTLDNVLVCPVTKLPIEISWWGTEEGGLIPMTLS